MMAARGIEAQQVAWFAARMMPLKNAGRTTALMGAEVETYRDARGRPRKRAVKDTGRRVFVHEHLLRQAGFEVFLPVRKEWRKVNRFGRQKELVSYPLLTGWLFVGFPASDLGWHDLAALGIVRAVMGAQGRPVRIGEAVMQEVMRTWGGGRLAPEHHRYLRTGREFSKGDRVRVIDGPYDQQTFDVVNISDKGVRGVLRLLGHDVEVEFAPDQVEPLCDPALNLDKTC